MCKLFPKSGHALRTAPAHSVAIKTSAADTPILILFLNSLNIPWVFPSASQHLLMPFHSSIMLPLFSFPSDEILVTHQNPVPMLPGQARTFPRCFHLQPPPWDFSAHLPGIWDHIAFPPTWLDPLRQGHWLIVSQSHTTKHRALWAAGIHCSVAEKMEDS